MADFTRELRLGSPQSSPSSFFSSSGSEAFSNLFKGLSRGLVDTVEANKTAEQANIEEDLAKGTRSIQEQMGLLPKENEVSDVGLKSQLDRLRVMQEAYNNSPYQFKANYSARMQSLVKDLKAKYGYRYGELIDKRVAQVVGFNPSEAILNSVLAEQEASQKTAEAEIKDWQTNWVNDEVAQRLFGERLFTDADTPEKRANMKRVIIAQKGFDAAREYDSKLSKEENTQNFNARSNSFVQNYLNNIFSNPTVAAAIQGRQPANAEEMGAIVNSVNGLETQLRAQLAKLAGEYPTIDAKDKQEIISKNLETIGFIKEALGSKDWNTINYYGNLAKYSTDQTTNTLSKYLDPADVKRAMTEGKDFWDTRLSGKNLTKDDVVRVQALLTSMPLSQALTLLDSDASMTDTRRNSLAASLLNDAQAYITSPSVPLDMRIRKAKEYLNPTNLNAILNMTEGGQDAFISKWANPQMGETIKALGDEQVTEMYMDSITSIMRTQYFKQLVDTVVKNTSNYANTTFVFDPTTKTLKLTIADPNAQGAEQTAGRLQRSPEMRELNTVLSSLMKAAEPIQGGDMGQEFQTVLQNMGLNVQTLEQEDKKAGIKGPEAQKPIEEMQIGPQLGELRAVRDAIAIGEGTSDEGGYDRMLAGFEQELGVQPSTMTVDEILALQNSDEYREFSKGIVGRTATPVGKYQIVGTTLAALKRRMGLTGNEVFTPRLQDQMFRELLRGRGYEDFRAGKIDINTLMDRLMKEWEGLEKDSMARQQLEDQLKTIAAQDKLQELQDRVNAFTGQ